MSRFRGPKNIRGRSDAEASSFGFLDGDFLEQFLAIEPSTEDMKNIMKGASEAERLTLSRDRIQKVLERLRSFH